jgi:dihydropteroate synthase
MGILNCSPDSFSGDGAAAAALAPQAEAMVRAGASWLDVGAVSSRPGAPPVSEAEEWQRLAPTLAPVLATGARVSVDTRRGAIARRCLAAGVHLINDISGGSDAELLQAVAEADADVCLMHMQGQPATMQEAPQYQGDDVVTAVGDFLEEAAQRALAHGIAKQHLVFDPGIGFGKTVAHNLALLAALPTLRARLGGRWLLGISRKRFLPAVVGYDLPAAERDQWSHLIHVQLASHCEFLRVHDVSGAAAALALRIPFHNL